MSQPAAQLFVGQFKRTSDDNDGASKKKALTFETLPLEMRIEVLKRVFIRDGTRPVHITYGTLLIKYSATLSAQLLRVSKEWHQFGSALLLDNVIGIPQATTLTQLVLGKVQKRYPSLYQVKHLEMNLDIFDSRRVKQLRKFKQLETLYLLDCKWAPNQSLVQER